MNVFLLHRKLLPSIAGITQLGLGGSHLNDTRWKHLLIFHKKTDVLEIILLDRVKQLPCLLSRSLDMVGIYH